MFGKLTVLFCVMLNLLCPAQSDSLQIVTEDTIEELLEEQENESDNSDICDLVQYYINNPANLNTSTSEELSSVPYLDMSVAQRIINHREIYGKFFSVYELYSLTEIQQSVIKKILPFITVDDDSSHNNPDKTQLNHFSLNIRTRLLSDLQRRKGYKNRTFAGSPYKIYNRLTLKYSDKIAAGLVTEKDAGEREYYDFYSGYIMTTGLYNFEYVIIGDYLFEFGQGLALWSPYGLSKGNNAVRSVKSNPRTIIPYKSSSENKFFRGIAIQYKWEHAGLSGFFSKKSVDAHIDSVTGYITSLPVDGYHRTNNEIRKKNNTTETSYGIRLNYGILSRSSLGFLYYSSSFNRPFSLSDRVLNSIRNFRYYSSYLNLYLLNYNIYCELSYSEKYPAYILGINFAPAPEFKYSFLIRNYPANYVNLHGYSFGEHGSTLKNEFGIYNGFRLRTSIGTLNLYYDQFKFPFSSSLVPLPSNGNEFMLDFITKPAGMIETRARIKVLNKEIKFPLDEQDQLVIRQKKSYRLDLIFSFSKTARIKTRLEYSKFHIKNTNSSEEGYLIFEDLRIKPASFYTLYFRIVFFKTDSFNSAIYEFENDLAGIFNSIGLYGEGLRLYMVLRYKLMDKINLSVKYSETYKPGEVKLGTGYQEIDGNTDNKLGLQLDITL